jgi:hypothetical protein
MLKLAKDKWWNFFEDESQECLSKKWLCDDTISLINGEMIVCPVKQGLESNCDIELWP